MSDFTPGPWHMDPEEVTGGFRIVPKIGDRGLAVAIQRDAAPAIPGSGIDRATAEANARLIAAAPELLEAASLIRAALQKHGEWDDGCFYFGGKSASELQSPIAALTAAIAKATGGAA